MPARKLPKAVAVGAWTVNAAGREAVEPMKRQPAKAKQRQTTAKRTTKAKQPFTVPVPQTTADVERMTAIPMRLGSAVVDPAAQLVTVPEAATLLRLSRATVYRLLQRGEMDSLKIGAARRIPLSALQAYITSYMTANAGQYVTR